MSPEARRSRAPRRRQQEILEAAAQVFHEKGYESTSIQDIADSVGILKGSLYYYITSKEDLLFEIIQGVHEEALKNLDRTAAIEGDALQKIRAFVVIHVTHNALNLVKMAVFFQDFRSLNGARRQTCTTPSSATSSAGARKRGSCARTSSRSWLRSPCSG